jgi:ubiquinone/menaquinone biosynthesis C-methylase UbiE
MEDRQGDSRWSRRQTVEGFAASPPNAALMQYAADELPHAGTRLALDIGCGAARNAVPLARQGWTVVGTDTSEPMLRAAMERAAHERVASRVRPVLASLDRLPIADRSCDLIVAHGIWNLARSDAEFRRGVREAARVSRPGAALFVFTFSRATLSPGAQPAEGQSYTFTEYSGEPQIFLTETQLVDELRESGFHPDPALPLRELNRTSSTGIRIAGGAPVILQAAFRRAG